MIIDKVIVGDLETNCYVLSIGSDVLIIDPGDDYEKIIDKVFGKNILGILVTHSHFDHVGALKYFDNVVYDYNNLSEKEYKIGRFIFDVIYTPGHTKDSICFYFKDDNVMFTGDFIFKGAIGRTDLGGNEFSMRDSLEKIKQYDDNIKIYPGHGESTILKDEKRRF